MPVPTTSGGRKLTALEIDRMSNEEWLTRGIAVRVPVRPPTPAEQAAEQRAYQRTRAGTPGIIYVVQAAPVMAVKIGFTRNAELAWRLKGIQTGCPYPLKVLASVKGLPAQEREAHALLSPYRLTGEWFDWTPQVQAFVGALANGIKAALTVPAAHRSTCREERG